ncbi:MAG: hypothetical protein ACLPJJ_00610 [Acidocella sp.]|uniref:hypothetical protein n=1 Tax=Acidocella sp. TaxID=50710 RepID=UPI003FC880C5
MAEDEERKRLRPANENGVETSGDGVETQRRDDALVLVIARALGRQMAREEFAKLRYGAANDNRRPVEDEDG